MPTKAVNTTPLLEKAGFCCLQITVTEPDLQIRAGGWGRWGRWGNGLNFFFLPFGPKFGLKIGGGGGGRAAPLDPPQHENNIS